MVVMKLGKQVKFVGQLLESGESLVDALRMAGIGFYPEPSKLSCYGQSGRTGVVRTPIVPERLMRLVWKAEELVVKGVPEAKIIIREVYSGKHELGILTHEFGDDISLADLRVYFLFVHFKDKHAPLKVVKILRAAGFSAEEVHCALDRARYFDE